MRAFQWFALIVVGALIFTWGFVTHLPTAFVWQQVQANVPEAKTIQLSESTGNIFSGQAQAAYQSVPELKFNRATEQRLQAIPPVNIQWQNSLSLFGSQTLQLDVQSNWLQGLFQIALAQSMQNIAIDSQMTAIDLATVSELVSNRMLPVKPRDGLLKIDRLSLQSDMKSDMQSDMQWAQGVQGEGSIENLNLMGTSFPVMRWQLSQPNEEIELSLNSEEVGNWALTGKGSVSPKGRYEFKVTLNVSKNGSLPDWGYLMRKRSNTEYEAVFKGRWL